MKKVCVIGAGFAGLSAACCLARHGFHVTILEKNESPGGRARKLVANGFHFDMGPSWYWMPDVFERFFDRFGKKPGDYYSLVRLDPSYRVFFSKDDVWDLPAGQNALASFFESKEEGSGKKLSEFLDDGKAKYEAAMHQLVYAPGLSLLELMEWRTLKGILSLPLFQSVAHYVRKSFRDPRLIQVLEFPVLFLGAPAQKIPALYTLMNYADTVLGTWYPTGGIHKIVEALVALARENGVVIELNKNVERILVRNGRVHGIESEGREREFDFVVAAGDYHHTEQHLLPKEYRRYSEEYWQDRKLAPSCLIFYLGISKKLANLRHHNLFFDRDFQQHSAEIYDAPAWPSDPLFYVSAPSVTDPSVAPEGHENLFILVPVAPGLSDTNPVREKYFNMTIDRLEALTGQEIRNHIVFNQSYAHSDFIRDYNSFKGNAYGLANTLRQTAHLKPSINNPRVKNLYYAGQLTVPGPGVPPALISGQIVADTLARNASKVRSPETILPL